LRAGGFDFDAAVIDAGSRSPGFDSNAALTMRGFDLDAALRMPGFDLDLGIHFLSPACPHAMPAFCSVERLRS
jgi:hypothetical protein